MTSGRAVLQRWRPRLGEVVDSGENERELENGTCTHLHTFSDEGAMKEQRNNRGL